MMKNLGLGASTVLARVGLLTLSFLAAPAVWAGAVFDAGEALMEALEKGATTGAYTDCQGGSWTFGDLGAGDLNAVQAFGGVYREASGFNGFTPNGSLTVPFAIVNTTSEPLTHGGETGNNPLMPGEIVLHPNKPSTARPYVAIQFRPPRTGVYRVDAEVRDMCDGGNTGGVIASLYARDAIQWSMYVGREKNLCITNGVVSIGLYLSANAPVTLIVDPEKAYDCDATGVFFTLTEMSSGFGPLVRDVNAEILAAATAASPVLPAGISCGYRNKAGVVTPYVTPYEQANINCKGFATPSGFPWVMVNTRNGISECDKSSVGNGYKLQPHELLTHPYTNMFEASFIQVAAPSAGVYRAVGVFRDVSNKVVNNYDGVIAAIRAPEVLQTKVLVSAEKKTGALVIEAPRLELAAGEYVRFEVGNNGDYRCDSTGMQLFLFADELPAGKNVVNVDIDGKQPADPAPVTYAGAARFASAGTMWNALSGVENAVPSLQKEHLRTADGTRTAVAVKLEAQSGNLMFDNLANATSAFDGNSLLNDYLYTTLTPVTLTITGLVAGASYDLYLYTACGRTNPPYQTVADFGGVTGAWQTESGKFFAGSTTNDHLVFVGVRADETGRIVGELHGGTVATGSGVFNGFQLVGTFPEDPTGLVFLVR